MQVDAKMPSFRAVSQDSLRLKNPGGFYLVFARKTDREARGFDWANKHVMFVGPEDLGTLLHSLRRAPFASEDQLSSHSVSIERFANASATLDSAASSTPDLVKSLTADHFADGSATYTYRNFDGTERRAVSRDAADMSAPESTIAVNMRPGQVVVLQSLLEHTLPLSLGAGHISSISERSPDVEYGEKQYDAPNSSSGGRASSSGWNF